MYRTAIVILVSLALQGCAAAGMTLFATGTGIAAGTGVEHTMNGIAYKTFAVSQNELRFATLKALHRMDMKVEKDQPSKEEQRIHEIVARANDRTIEVEIEAITNRTARMRVVANKGHIFFKDASTASEIIMQTAHNVDEQIARHEQQVQAR
jgi:hypothetical protein